MYRLLKVACPVNSQPCATETPAAKYYLEEHRPDLASDVGDRTSAILAECPMIANIRDLTRETLQ